jgi:release factor glutamine methyltransferase
MTEDSEQRVDAVLRRARAKLDPVDAEWLLAHALGRPRAWLYAHADDKVDAGTQARFAGLVERRAAGEPVAYLTRSRGFWSFDLRVTPDTLIPRPETELLVELALARLPRHDASRIADLGTGSGAIALALARERPDASVVATDASEAALAVARGNAAALGIGNVRFGRGDWCAALDDAPFDLIVSNPPYIADDDPHLAAGDLRFEPLGALGSGPDGLDAIRAIIRGAPAHLVPGGWLLLEHGVAQGSAVRALLHAAGFIDVGTARDLEDRDRVTLGRRSA